MKNGPHGESEKTHRGKHPLTLINKIHPISETFTSTDLSSLTSRFNSSEEPEAGSKHGECKEL